MRKRKTDAEAFIEHIKTLIKNLLINNVNYTNRYYYKLNFAIDELIKDTKERGRWVLEQIEQTKHLIGVEEEDE